MLELRFHGRGGQGTVVATILMAKAFFRAGWEVQSFPLLRRRAARRPGGGLCPPGQGKDSPPNERHRS